MSIEIIPAIIPKNFRDLEEKMSRVSDIVPFVQIDVMDGKLTPEPSWPYLDLEEDSNFVSIKKEERGFPFWESLEFEVDLMVQNPELVWHDWVAAGASRIIFHIESSKHMGELVKTFRKEMITKEQALSLELGVALDIETPNQELEPLLADIDFVQFMGIAKIGFQGQPFDKRVVEKIRDFKSRHGTIIVSVDGGVNLDSAPLLVEAGADRLVAGSAILKSSDISETIEKFKNLTPIP